MNASWRPTATIDTLRRRAEIIAQIRAFFAARQVLEVETPLLSTGTVTDPHLESFYTHYEAEDGQAQTLYLQTSPEFAMKRLVAAGSGPIYQITHAFRNRGEQGRWHNPEFTILEWYRPGFSLVQLMDETEALLHLILDGGPAQRMSYAELFDRFLGLDPHQATLAEIKQTLTKLPIHLQSVDSLTQREVGLQLIVDHLIQNRIENPFLFLYDFPASQAALARIQPGSPDIAERVEVYGRGLELANGFHELADPIEQKERFLNDLTIRKQQHLPSVAVDHQLIAALTHGLPDCSGIALGIDRLVTLATQSSNLAEVMTFPITRA
jgi:lysyl-tRNA synthetase class 2